MFEQAPILIAEDETIVAIDLAFAVEDADGRVVGPFATVSESIRALENHLVTGAILDVQLGDRDVTPLALYLAGAGIPFILHTATGMPVEVAALWPDVPVILKPASPSALMESLEREMRKHTDLGSSGPVLH